MSVYIGKNSALRKTRKTDGHGPTERNDVRQTSRGAVSTVFKIEELNLETKQVTKIHVVSSLNGVVTTEEMVKAQVRAMNGYCCTHGMTNNPIKRKVVYRNGATQSLQ